MGRVERIFVYGILSILLLTAFGRNGLDMTPAATANETPAKDTLGPADELLLKGKDGELTIMNGDGRIAWNEDDTSRAWSAATVNLTQLMPEILKRESYAEELSEMENMAREQNSNFEEQFKALQDEYGEIGPDDPKFPEAQQRAQALMTKYNEWQQGTLQIRGKKVAEQIERAYREVVEAVEVVAENQKIDMVYRFIPTSEEFVADSPEAASEQIRLRTFLRYPEEIDITGAVREELGL